MTVQKYGYPNEYRGARDPEYQIRELAKAFELFPDASIRYLEKLLQSGTWQILCQAMHFTAHSFLHGLRLMRLLSVTSPKCLIRGRSIAVLCYSYLALSASHGRSTTTVKVRSRPVNCVSTHGHSNHSSRSLNSRRVTS